jgi:hypothetical protein
MEKENNDFMTRFINALKRNNETYESFTTNFIKTSLIELEKKGLEVPEHKTRCICEQPIEKNCYCIDENTNKILVLGSCCIKKTMSKEARGRHCFVCREPFRGRKSDTCNSCLESQRRKNIIKYQNEHKYSKIKMSFGKYKDKLVKDIYDTDLNYFNYILPILNKSKGQLLYEAFNYYKI